MSFIDRIINHIVPPIDPDVLNAVEEQFPTHDKTVQGAGNHVWVDLPSGEVFSVFKRKDDGVVYTCFVPISVKK